MPAALHGGSHTRSASTEKLFMRTPVPAADVILLPMEIIIEGTALTPAILQIASEGSVTVMNDAYRERLEQYLASMLQAKHRQCRPLIWLCSGRQNEQAKEKPPFRTAKICRLFVA